MPLSRSLLPLQYSNAVIQLAAARHELNTHKDCSNRAVVCVFIIAVPITKLFAWGEGDHSGGHVLRETTVTVTSRGLVDKSAGVCVYYCST